MGLRSESDKRAGRAGAHPSSLLLVSLTNLAVRGGTSSGSSHLFAIPIAADVTIAIAARLSTTIMTF